MKIKKIVPRGKWVLIKPAKEADKETSAGILIPHTEESEKKAVGIVESVGEDVKDIKKGDEVIFGMFAGEIIKREENGKQVEYKLVLEEDIISFLV